MKFKKLHRIILHAHFRGGGAYLFANHKGGDGGRLYFDGCCLICVNGEFIAQGSQFSVSDVEVITATIDLNDIHSYRQGYKASQEQASTTAIKPLPSIDISLDFTLYVCNDNNNDDDINSPTTTTTTFLKGLHSALCKCQHCRVTPKLEIIRYHSTEEECVLGPACWMWDYLRRSSAAGKFRYYSIILIN